MDHQTLYAVDYIRRVTATNEHMEKPQLSRCGADNYEALVSLHTAHQIGGAQQARQIWHTMLVHQYTVLARSYGMLRHLYSLEHLKVIPPMRYALPEYAIFEGGFNLLFGHRGTGKSFFGVDVACRYAQLGKRVLYIAAEGVPTYNPRVAAWHDYHNVALSPNLYFWAQPVPVGDVSAFEVWRGAVADGLEPHMIVVDTVARCMTGMDENSTRDMGRYVEVWQQFANNGVTLLHIHHTNRGGAQRGSIALDSAADSVLVLRRNDGLIEVRNDLESGGKNKAGEEVPPIYFRIKPHSVGEFTGEHAAAVLEKGQPGEGDTLEVGALTQTQLDVLDAVEGIEEGLTANEIMEYLKASRAIYKTLKGLVKTGYLQRQATLFSLTEKGEIALNSNRKGLS